MYVEAKGNKGKFYYYYNDDDDYYYYWSLWLKQTKLVYILVEYRWKKRFC